MKQITNKILWIFAVGQFGWSLLSGIVTNWLVYYYTDETAGIFGKNITTGTLFLSITLFGLITMVGRIFDAVTDPLIASWSDRSNFKGGRRIPFMKAIAIPFAVVTAGVFIVPQTGSVVVNDILIFVMLILFYLFMTIYCTPYNALISELGNNQKNRINVSTYISFTYIVGLSVSFLIPNLAGVFEESMGKEGAVKMAIGIMCIVAAVAMIFPTLLIKEREYIESKPVETTAFKSLFKSFSNRQFARFVISDVIYFFAVTLFQTGLPFYETKLMNLPDTFTFTLTVIMTVVSLCLYPLINKLAPRLGKKKIIITGFFAYALVFLLASVCQKGLAWGIIIAVCAGVPMAILGILPQAVVADIAEVDAYQSGEERSGMFFAARTFAMKMGQAISMLVFTSVVAAYKTGSTTNPLGYRVTAIIATVCCIIGAVLFFFYDEKMIMGKLAEKNGKQAE
jgi:GPH family glycoside/pentoside/hexuronide:cation symporter